MTAALASEDGRHGGAASASAYRLSSPPPTTSSSTSSASLSRRHKALADALAGVAAALVAQLVTYPLDVHKTRTQASSHHNSRDDDEDEDGDDAGGRTNRQEDDNVEEQAYRASRASFSSSTSPSTTIVNFAGWKVKVLHTSASTFCYFYLCSFLLSLHRARRRSTGHQSSPRKVSNSAHLLLSAAAAMLNTLITLPLDVISSRQQVCVRSCDDKVAAAAAAAAAATTAPTRYRENHGTTSSPPPSTRPPSLSSWSHVSELWRGLIPSLLLCANPAINYTVYDALKDHMLRPQQKQQQHSPRATKPQLSALQAFGLGIVAKFAATIVTYPLIRAKVLLMVGSATTSRSNDDAGNSPPSTSTTFSVATLLQCLADDYRHNGILGGWYRGCTLQLAHTLLKSALLMAIKERITGSVREAVMMATSAAGSSRRAVADQH